MIAVISEMVFNENCMENYLEIAADLKESLMQMKGFIRSERFSSLVQERKILSLSIWEDEHAVEAWRNLLAHRQGQQQARDKLFESYCITVTQVVRQYTADDRSQAPKDSNEYFLQLGS